MPDSASARRCNGVLTSTRGRAGCDNTAATSAGNNGRSAWTVMFANSGSSTVNSMPYM